MIKITNLLVLLLFISFILSATTIKQASASTDNDISVLSGESTDNNNTATMSSGESSDNNNTVESSNQSTNNDHIIGNAQQQNNNNSSDNTTSSNVSTTNNSIGNELQESNNAGNVTSNGGGNTITTTTTDNSSSSTTTSTQNDAALSNGSTVSNNTGNAYCETCNNDIYYGGGDLKSMVLAVHNRERAAVGVPPLVWNDTLAAYAKAWAEYLAKLGKLIHCGSVPTCNPHGEGENLASGGNTMNVPIAQNMQGWITEKNVFQGLPSATGTDVVGHYTQMVWKSTTRVGCGTASGGPDDSRGWDILVCRYLTWGNTGPNPFQ